MAEERKVAIVFPGQGSQKLGMLKNFYEQYSCFRERMAQASDVLGYDLWQLIQQDEEKLNQTKYTQPALLACSMGIWDATKENWMPQLTALAGHSLGEYSALVAGGVLDFADAVRLVALRGEWMQEAADSAIGDHGAGNVDGAAETGMLVVVGLDEKQVQQLRGSDNVNDENYLVIANHNSPQQFVLSGYRSACQLAADVAKNMGAKIAKLLPVSVASHSALMQVAAEKLEDEFTRITFHAPTVPIYRDVDGGIHSDPSRIPLDLKLQTVTGVQWVTIVRNMVQNGVTHIYECGPGRVLTGLNKQIVTDLAANSAEAPAVETVSLGLL